MAAPTATSLAQCALLYIRDSPTMPARPKSAVTTKGLPDFHWYPASAVAAAAAANAEVVCPEGKERTESPLKPRSSLKSYGLSGERYGRLRPATILIDPVIMSPTNTASAVCSPTCAVPRFPVSRPAPYTSPPSTSAPGDPSRRAPTEPFDRIRFAWNDGRCIVCASCRSSGAATTVATANPAAKYRSRVSNSDGFPPLLSAGACVCACAPPPSRTAAAPAITTRLAIISSPRGSWMCVPVGRRGAGAAGRAAAASAWQDTDRERRHRRRWRNLAPARTPAPRRRGLYRSVGGVPARRSGSAGGGGRLEREHRAAGERDARLHAQGDAARVVG